MRRVHVLLFVTAAAVAHSGLRVPLDAQQFPSSAVPSSSSKEALENQFRGDLAEKLVSLREEASRREFDPEYREALVYRLSQMPIETLQEAQITGVLPQPHLSDVPNVVGDTSSDLVFVPITPCRVFDTRVGAGGFLNPGSTRSLYVAGTLTGQGGAANCGIPFGPATAVVINITATEFPGTGWLSVGPVPAAVPLSTSTLNYATGMGLAIANATVLRICDPSAASCLSGDLNFGTGASGTHLIGDVAGYFRAFVPDNFRRSQTNTFVTIPVVGATPAQLNSLTFTPRFTGSLLVRARGYCNITANNVSTRINTAIGTTPTEGFAGASFDEWGIIEPHAGTFAGNTQAMNYTAERVFSVTRGVAVTLGVYGRKEFGTASANCQGSFVVEGIF